MRTNTYRALLSASLISLALPAALTAQQRSERDPEVRIERLPGTMSITFGSSNRAVLGVTMSSSGRADTEGVRIEAVDENGPAAKSGLKAGDVITSVNGVSLRVSADDAADPSLGALAQRRLTRTLSRAKAGDVVELRVQSGSTSRNVSVKTVSAAELEGQTSTRIATRSGSTSGSTSARSDDDNHGMIGMSIGGSGNARDTLGLFVNSVVTNGPAEKAGVTEGERIAAVNGVDVRVPREDLEDMSATTARANRFIREVQKVAPGGTVSLRVYSGGRYRDVSVRTVRSADLPNQGFRMSIGDGGMSMSMPRLPNALREGRVFMSPGTMQFDREALERAMQQLRESVRETVRDSTRVRVAPLVRVAPRRAI